MSSPKDDATPTQQSQRRLQLMSKPSDVDLLSVSEPSVAFGIGSGWLDECPLQEESYSKTPMGQKTPSINNLSLSKLSFLSHCNKYKYCCLPSVHIKPVHCSLFANPLIGSKAANDGALEASNDTIKESSGGGTSTENISNANDSKIDSSDYLEESNGGSASKEN
eukprot:10854102-Ditylum_brightwellii.AAC.1